MIESPKRWDVFDIFIKEAKDGQLSAEMGKALSILLYRLRIPRTLQSGVRVAQLSFLATR
jgi:hypothetical protein